MLRRALTSAAGALRQRHSCHALVARRSSSSSSSSGSTAVNSIILRSLKDHYLEVSKMTPPPKISPPSPFTVVKGALDGNGPVLERTHGNEEIRISVMRLANIIPGGGDENDEDDINQLFVHVDISKPGQKESLHFLCGLYPDALGIHSVSLRTRDDTGFLEASNKYGGPVFQDIDERTRDAFHSYIEERGISESLFPFLQAWLYVKDHRNLMRWFRTIGNINVPQSTNRHGSAYSMTPRNDITKSNCLETLPGSHGVGTPVSVDWLRDVDIPWTNNNKSI